MDKLIRIATVPVSLEKLLEGQLNFMSNYFEVIAVSAEKGKLEEYGKATGIPTYCVEMTREITPIKDLKALFKLYFFLKKEKPLIVHTHTPKAGIIGMMAAKVAGVPLRFHTVAGLPLLETRGSKRKILNKVERLTYSFATMVYPNSTGLKEIILKEKFCRPEKLKVLGRGSSNGIDTAYFNPAKYSDKFKRHLRAELGIPAADMVCIFVGRLVSEKGINELVKAFVELNQEYDAVSLLLVGDYEEELDPLSETTIAQIEEHSKIYTTGFQNDVRPYFAISDILTFPSYREGFPNVVMQAGAMGLPAIVSNINGCNEIIKQNKNGLIIEVKNKNALLEAMKELYNNKKLVIGMKGNARKIIDLNYGREDFWKILLKEYQIQKKEIIR
ncbi:glycosyltransferase family 4 protein [Zunongwangia sp. F363]|uniref:Glycosyltransferase family 4 protein n=1 Tax=Autumnicola tepida TaxID=3075595 RepID=A0ABU3CE16_9FLAO|nr:glycosyltransferase family 4 protein [Zunongwangia sp. F363]MDT0644580.1 glycosyltransferase family 4 protein [Zunongwangia sp. F363]